jgi:hypothetical protein
VTAEDDPSDTIRPRLDSHHADVTRVHLLAGIHRDEPDGTRAEFVFTLTEVEALEAALQQLEDCRLVVVDPIGSFLGAGTDGHRDNEVRAVLAPVAKLAERYGPAVLVVAHRRKSAGGFADDTALGSRAFTGIARSVWHLSRDAESRDRRLLLPGKTNLSAEQPGLAFSIQGDPAVIRWEREPVAMTADEALAREQGGHENGSQVDEATAWLAAALSEGPLTAKEVRALARRDGFAWRTVERAKSALSVKCQPSGFGGPWVWRLANSLRPESPVSAKKNSLAETGETVADTGGLALTDEQRLEAEAAWIHDSY